MTDVPSSSVSVSGNVTAAGLAAGDEAGGCDGAATDGDAGEVATGDVAAPDEHATTISATSRRKTYRAERAAGEAKVGTSDPGKCVGTGAKGAEGPGARPTGRADQPVDRMVASPFARRLSIDREIGDRDSRRPDRALVTVAGLCRTLTGFATPRHRIARRC